MVLKALLDMQFLTFSIIPPPTPSFCIGSSLGSSGILLHLLETCLKVSQDTGLSLLVPYSWSPHPQHKIRLLSALFMIMYLLTNFMYLAVTQDRHLPVYLCVGLLKKK